MTSIGPSRRRVEAAADIHAHPAVRRVGEADRQAAEALARDVARALAPLRALAPDRLARATASPRIGPRSPPRSLGREGRRTTRSKTRGGSSR